MKQIQDADMETWRNWPSGQPKELSPEKVREMAIMVSGHRQAGEEEVFLGTEELAALLKEVLNHRVGAGCRCTAEHVEVKRSWGYDG